MRFLHTAAALLAGLGVTAGVHADDPAFASSASRANTGGAEVYVHVCQGCHMPEGQGAAGAARIPNLAGNPALVSWQYAALTVLNGRGGMPAFGEPKDHVTEFAAVHLSDARIADVVNYIRGHFGNRWSGKVTESQVAALPHPGSEPPP